MTRVRYATYLHTRALVKWADGEIILECRTFVRWIANGNSFNGDRMIYLKAKELEDAYWGYMILRSIGTRTQKVVKICHQTNPGGLIIVPLPLGSISLNPGEASTS